MSAPIHVSKTDFEEQVLASNVPVVVDFWADWCAPCHRVAPVLDELAATYAGKAAVAKVNVDDETELARKYSVRSIPTFLFFRDGQVVDRLSGALPKAQLTEHFEALLEKT